MISNELAIEIKKQMKDALGKKASNLENPFEDTPFPEAVYPLFKDLRHHELEFTIKDKSYTARPAYRENNFFIVSVNMTVCAIEYADGAFEKQGAIWELTPELTIEVAEQLGTQSFIKMNTRKKI